MRDITKPGAIKIEF